jgi:WD40 repeat protein
MAVARRAANFGRGNSPRCEQSLWALLLLCAVNFVLLNTGASAQVGSAVQVVPQTGQNGITAVAISADGRYILSGSAENTIKLWDVARKVELRTFTGHRDRVASVAFSADGKSFASGSWDNTVKLWDLETGKIIFRPSIFITSKPLFAH